MATTLDAAVKAKVDSLSFPPQRILMAPGPSNLHPRVLQALIAPLTGHKDPYFLAVMEETAGLLRQVGGAGGPPQPSAAGPAPRPRSPDWTTPPTIPLSAIRCRCRETRSSSGLGEPAPRTGVMARRTSII